ncbi:hypothetical protein D3C81_804160 [compost metagenome]
MHAQDGRLWRVDDRGRQHGAEGAAVRDREGTARQVVQGQLAFFGFRAEFTDFFLDVGDRQLVRVADDRHDQAAWRTDSDADVEVAVVNDVVAVNGSVDDRVLFQGGDSGLDEEGHEAQLDAVLFLELVLVLVAQVDDRLHVHFIERGQDGVRRLRLQQALGDTRAQAAHRHALFRTVAQVGGRRGGHLLQRWLGSGWRQRRNGRLGGSGQGVALGHAAIFARTGDVASGQAFFRQDLGGGRHGDIALGRGSWCGGGSGVLRGGSQGWCRNGRHFHRADLGRAVGIDDGDDFAGNDGGAVSLDDLHDHASGWRRQFQDHFIGFDIDHVFVARHWLADFFMPCQQGRFCNRFRQLRNFDFDLCHVKLRLFCSCGAAPA